MTDKIDPKNYPFKKYIDSQKHLDTDNLRHTIKPIVHIIDQDFKGLEHKHCDKSQLCPLGKFRRPKIMVEAEQRGFASAFDMMEADKKKKEEVNIKKVEQQQTIIDNQQTIIDNQKTEIDDMKMKMDRMMAWAATMGFSG